MKACQREDDILPVRLEVREVSLRQHSHVHPLTHRACQVRATIQVGRDQKPVKNGMVERLKLRAVVVN
jgi:hypothetical protein